MLDILAIARVLLEIASDVYRWYRRSLMQPLLTALCLTGAYAVVHVTQEGSLATGLRLAFFDNDTSRAERRRLELQALLQAELHQFSEANKLIDQHLQTLLLRGKASRVHLDVIHNGVTGLTGTGLLRYDVTNSVAAPGRSTGAAVQNQPLSDWSEFLPTLLAGQCAMQRVSELASVALRARFEGFGATSVMICPAADIQGKAVGATYVFWDSNDTPPAGDALRDMMDAGRHVGAQIAAVLDLRGPPPWPVPPLPADN